MLRHLSILVTLAFSACRNDSAPSGIELLLPDGKGQRVVLEARSAFAEYVELPDLRRELRITLANFPASCERYAPPGPSELLFVITVTAPPADVLRPGTFPLVVPEAPSGAAGTGSEKITRATSLAVVRQGERAFVFPTGGTLELRELNLGPAGRVTGLIAFEYAGDGTRPAASARGKFEARICRSQ